MIRNYGKGKGFYPAVIWEDGISDADPEAIHSYEYGYFVSQIDNDIFPDRNEVHDIWDWGVDGPRYRNDAIYAACHQSIEAALDIEFEYEHIHGFDISDKKLDRRKRYFKYKCKIK